MRLKAPHPVKTMSGHWQLTIAYLSLVTHEVVVDAPVRPQAILVGFGDMPEEEAAMAGLVAHSQSFESMPGSQQVRWADWDVVITKGTSLAVPPHVHVLSVGTPAATGWLAHGVDGLSRASRSFIYNGQQPSPTITVNNAAPDRLRRLVNEDLVPWLRSQPFRPYLEPFDGLGGTASVVRIPRDPAGLVLAVEADGHVIAGMFPRHGGDGWLLMLPHVPARPQDWLAAAIDLWRAATPERFVSEPSWQDMPEWQTRAEREAATALALQAERREATITQLDEEGAALEVNLAAARTAAEAGARRLLTCQGEELVSAVVDALRSIGFVVVDADAELPQGQAKQEDLWLSDPTDSGWTNITEVKGYRNGAKARDLQILARRAAIFQNRTGALPGSRWYVVNAFLQSPPGERPPLLAGGDEDLAVFAEDGGLAIDTRDLFRLTSLVETAVLTADDARSLLRTATGRLVLPAI